MAQKPHASHTSVGFPTPPRAHTASSAPQPPTVLALSSFSANNFAMKGKRKTLNASDVLSAMEEMEFQRFVTPLKEALEGNDPSVF